MKLQVKPRRVTATMAEGYNWFLILVTIVVGILVVVANLHILVHFQHPEDRNQAWVPKVVVIFGLSLAMMSVLMFPLDVANRSACSDHVALSACDFAMPMKVSGSARLGSLPSNSPLTTTSRPAPPPLRFNPPLLAFRSFGTPCT